jgi:hypothetical protein
MPSVKGPHRSRGLGTTVLWIRKSVMIRRDPKLLASSESGIIVQITIQLLIRDGVVPEKLFFKFKNFSTNNK